MAKDLQLKHKCPHLVVNEWLALEEDQQTLKTVRNPSSKSIVVRRNGIEIPKRGLVSKVSFSGRRSQPFTLERSVSDEFKFQTENEVLQTVKLPTGSEVGGSQIASAINEQSSGITASVLNGKIHIESNSGGEDSVIFLMKGSGHPALGLPSHRFYQGRIVVPSWTIVRNENEFDENSKAIRFNSRPQSTDDIFEVSYHTQRKECRRCLGIGIENDLRYDSKGNPHFVEGVDLLVQEVDKIVFTIRGSNTFYSWYGTSLMDLIGQKITGSGQLVESQLVTEIALTLDRYRDVKIQQSKLQPVRDQEFLLRVQNIEVQQDDLDPTVFRIKIDLQNRANEVDRIQKVLVINDIDGFERVR